MSPSAQVRKAILFTALLAGACGAEPVSGGPGTTCPITVVPSHPTFSADVLPAIQRSCGSSTSTCHGGPSAYGHVDYSTSLSRTAMDVYGDLVGATPANAPAGWLRVTAGDPAHSWIIEKVSSDQPGGSGYGARMPLGRPDLCATTIGAFTAWIASGAPF